MSEDYSQVPCDAVEERERRGGGATSRDIAGALGVENLTLRVWRYRPGQAMALHRHETQEEVYHLMSGGPQTLQIGERTVTVQPGDWIRVSKDTPRRIINSTEDREAVWITIGAPVGKGITDGIRLDPETGAEIPRT